MEEITFPKSNYLEVCDHKTETQLRAREQQRREIPMHCGPTLLK